jgi:NADPH:quinone reductase
VSAAAGGVGTFAVQLLARRGVRVLGIASARNADWLSGHGAVPVTYGDSLRERLLAAAGPGGVDAFIDLFGRGQRRIWLSTLASGQSQHSGREERLRA